MSNNGNNRTGWKNPEYDRLMREANSTVDLKAREKLLQKAETLLIKEELPIVPLFVYAGLEYYDPARITGIFPNIRQEHPIRSIHNKGAARAIGTMR
jgi:oligopeptide transport system substrate-binding protein